MRSILLALLAITLARTTLAAEPAKSPYTRGNRLAYLDEINPYYPHRDFARLITPQWVGEKGVEAVVILSIDDMRDPVRYEQFLRPILDRLKKVENSQGKAPLSIFVNSVDPKHAQLQTWLKEGLSFEVHTVTHPCPCLGAGAPPQGDIHRAKQTYDGCVDLLASIPNYKGPVAFRMPCCDSMNSVSPRFFAEVMNKTTAKGNFLSIDSSVFNIFTSDDPALPRELVLDKDADGKPRERFAKYTQFPGYINTIENYPYPYLIGNMIWQFPCVVPSDWEAQHLHGKNNPKTIEDLKAALDCTVIKQGVFTLCFHPHGWIAAEQIVELIDHAEKKHGNKVRFLNFQEALERINKNLLAGQAVRNEKGLDNGVRVIDVNGDGAIDALIGSETQKQLRLWDSSAGDWAKQLPLTQPLSFYWTTDEGERFHSGTRIGLRSDGKVLEMIQYDGPTAAFWQSDRRGFNLTVGGPADHPQLKGVQLNGKPVITGANGTLFRDIDRDGEYEIIYARGGDRGIFRRTKDEEVWEKLPYSFPDEIMIATKDGQPTGLCFVDLNGDGRDDVVQSGQEGFHVYLFASDKTGWATRVVSAKRGDPTPETRNPKPELPPIIRADGTNNGFFVKGDALYWQNEDTGGKEPHHVKKITFKEVLALADSKPQARELQAPVPAAPNHPFTTDHATPPPPRSPEASRDSIVLIPGFRAELVAAEPLVMDPIAFDFGPDGKLWVVEMGDYPSGVPDADGKMKPAGRVVFLEDTDNDGKYDKRTVFLDDLNFPTSIMVWNKGVLITAAPDIFYAEDSTPDDADRKADKRITLFTGFNEGNQQHRVNGLRWGMDGWVYVANGDSGGRIVSLWKDADQSTLNRETFEKFGKNINGRDLRIRPWEWASFQTHFHFAIASSAFPPPLWELDPQSGQSQFGRDRDDFGNWFGSNNPNPGWHYALEDHYLRRNPHVAAPNPRVDLTGDRTIFPISIVYSPSIENHRFTPGTPGQSAVHSSACSLTIYRDDLYGEAFTGNAFVSEPVHNLVRRMVLKPQGVTFRAERAPGEEKREFLASTDPWFRPTMTRTGPDGCLWIADMYRQTIEHPQWIPPDWQKTLDLRAGHDKGRIYRIVPAETKPRTPVRLDKLDAKGLVAAMDSPNGWQRDMAQMMLMWRRASISDHKKHKELIQDLAIIDQSTPAWTRKLQELERFLNLDDAYAGLSASALNAANPAVRVQSLNTLAMLEMISLNVLTRAATDAHPRVREHVVRISEASRGVPWKLSPKIDEAITAALLNLVDDPDIRVRQQLAYVLGDWLYYEEYRERKTSPEPRAGKALAQLLLKDADDPYIVAACMSSILPHLDTVTRHILAQPGGVGTYSKVVAQLIDIAVAEDRFDLLGAMLDGVTQPQGDRYQPWQFASLSRLLDALAKKKVTFGAMRGQAGTKGNPRLLTALDRIPNVLTAARSAIVDASQDESLRLAAIELFARQGGEHRAATFTAALADVKSPPAVQQGAAGAILRLNDDRATARMLDGWKTYGPALRNAILDGLLRSDKGVALLLDAMQAQAISRHDIDLPRRQPLLSHKDAAVRERAAKLLGGAPDADRRKVIDAYAGAMAALPREAASGDRLRGEQVFAKNCAVCHKPATGDAIGPELSKILDGSPQALLISILDPNQAVESKYVNYLVETNDGEKHTGIIMSETSTGITLASVDGKQRQILRRDIAELRSTGLSLMPAGLEQAITPADMADLFAYIASTTFKRTE